MSRFVRKSEGYDITQVFADENFSSCPICGTGTPEWLTSYKYRGLLKYYLFKCSHCASVLSISEADATGWSYTNASVYGKMKSKDGKEARTNYIRVEEIGLDIRDPLLLRLEKREIPMEELKNYRKTIE